jgi:hypothetical protein
MRRASLFASVALILLLACAPAAPRPTEPLAAIPVPTATATAPPGTAVAPEPADECLLARRAVLREACAAPQIPPEALAIHEDLCAHFDDGDATPPPRARRHLPRGPPRLAGGGLCLPVPGRSLPPGSGEGRFEVAARPRGIPAHARPGPPLDSYAYLSLAEATNATGNAEDALRHYGIALRPRRGWGQKKPPWRRASPWGTSG